MQDKITKQKLEKYFKITSKALKIAEKKSSVIEVIRRVINPRKHSASLNGIGYELMPKTNTYALGVQALRDAYSQGKSPNHPVYNGENMVRPLTFRENILARVEDYKGILDNGKGKDKKEETEQTELKKIRDKYRVK